MQGATVHSKGRIMQSYLAFIVIGRLETCGLLPFKNVTSWMRTQKLVCCDAEYPISDSTVVLYTNVYVCMQGWWWLCMHQCSGEVVVLLLNKAICPKVQTVQLNQTYILPSEIVYVKKVALASFTFCLLL